MFITFPSEKRLSRCDGDDGIVTSKAIDLV